MEYQKLGNSELNVSKICLGTMTFGEQNNLEESFLQLNTAIDFGINFIDTAELYPVPPKKETYGQTEIIIGKWLKTHKITRDKIILASKISSRSEQLNYIRNGNLMLNNKNIELAINDSLKRLNTDYIDLYQLHWPDRKSNYFGKLDYTHDPTDIFTNFEETLSTLNNLQKAGKIRHFGVSNETPWGLMKYLQLSEKLNFSKMISIQNPYNLLNRSFEIGLAEISIRENVGLLPYSPLAMGVLTGKYLKGKKPKNARLSIWTHFKRYLNPTSEKATNEYMKIAKKFDLDLNQMSLAFTLTKPFVISTIVGATNNEQLISNINSINLKLNDEILKQIDNIHKMYPNPCP